MLYLLRSFIRGGSILKIGYASSLERRTDDYRSSNPGIELISTREGTKDDESLLHVYLHFFKYKAVRTEWYQDNDEVISKFHSNISSIKSFLWKHREGVFPKLWEKRKTMGKWKRIYELISEGKTLSATTSVDLLYYKLCGLSKPPRRLTYKTKVDQFLKEFDSLSSFPEKMKLICKFMDSSSLCERNIALAQIPKKMKNFYLVLGNDILKKSEFAYCNCSKEFWNLIIHHKVEKDIKSSFIIGDKLSRKEIKSKLKIIYDRHSYTRSPKASDIKKYYDIDKYYDKREEKLLIKSIKP